MVKVLVWYWLAMKVAEENILKCERTEKSKEICLAHLTCPWKQEKIPIPVGQYKLPFQYTSHCTKLMFRNPLHIETMMFSVQRLVQMTIDKLRSLFATK